MLCVVVILKKLSQITPQNHTPKIPSSNIATHPHPKLDSKVIFYLHVPKKSRTKNLKTRHSIISIFKCQTTRAMSTSQLESLLQHSTIVSMSLVNERGYQPKSFFTNVMLIILSPYWEIKANQHTILHITLKHKFGITYNFQMCVTGSIFLVVHYNCVCVCVCMRGYLEW